MTKFQNDYDILKLTTNWTSTYFLTRLWRCASEHEKWCIWNMFPNNVSKLNFIHVHSWKFIIHHFFDVDTICIYNKILGYIQLGFTKLSLIILLTGIPLRSKVLIIVRLYKYNRLRDMSLKIAVQPNKMPLGIHCCKWKFWIRSEFQMSMNSP